jgi:hypothetical protein
MKIQAGHYARLFQLYKQYSAHIARVSIWGLEDPASWRRQGRPVLFDGDFNAKEAFYAVADPDGYLAGRYDDKNTRDALLIEAFKPGEPEPGQAPNLSAASTWARENIQQAYDKGFIPAELQSGYARAITRGEFVRLAMSWLRYETDMTNDQLVAAYAAFPDRTFSDTSDAELLAAAKLGITAGAGDGAFGVDDIFNREQAAMMLVNIYTHVFNENTANAPDAGFADMDKASGWAKNAINFAGTKEIMRGTGGGDFDPGGTFSREQSISVFNNMKR